MTGNQPMTYASTGVNYGAMDPTKVDAQQIGRTTSHLLRFGYREVDWTRGESVFLIEGLDHYLGFVVEGLGTKNLVAELAWHILGKQGLQAVGQDAVAMIVNDMITLGVLPLVIGQYLAAGSDRWFRNPERAGALALGWTEACKLAGVDYGCGETPTLRDIIVPSTVDIAGASVGMIKPKDWLIDPRRVSDNDEIVILGSSGVHANGITLIRDIGDMIGFGTQLEDGRTFAEAVLEPTHIYVPIIEQILREGIRPHYGVNITGHGWRKLMRWERPFAYVIEDVPQPPEVFDFIQHHAGVDDREMYGNYNMGAGFALYVDPVDTPRVCDIAREHGISAMPAGWIEESDQRKVVIRPLELEFVGDELTVR